MTPPDHRQLARDLFGAFVAKDRRVVEEILAVDFEFFSPADPGIDRQHYFERCWPNSELIDDIRFVRLAEAGDDVFVTYEGTKSDGSRFRNTEVLTFVGERLRRAEVYFGWNL